MKIYANQHVEGKNFIIFKSKIYILLLRSHNFSGCGYYGKCIETNVCGCGFSPKRCNHGSCTPDGKCKCGHGLTRFVDSCVSPSKIDSLVNTYEQRQRLNKDFILEFNAIIGHLFKFET